MKQSIFLLSVVLVCGLVSCNQPIYITPMPVSLQVVSNDIFLAHPFTFSTSSNSQVLINACQRYTMDTFTHTPESTGVPNAPNSLKVITESSDENLQLGVDESYILDTSKMVLNAKTVWGALRGLETFSQITRYNFTRGLYQTSGVMIQDAPRFAYRGMLIDTSRHFETVASLKRLIRSLSYVKYNTLHWHMVDDQSFPVESKHYPLLWSGAYSSYERFSVNDIKSIVSYAKGYGIRVIFEFDMPGHARSWCKGYPELCPSPSCNSPLDVSKNNTFDFITNLLSEYITYFPDQYIHLGGDEVDTSCWDKVPSVSNWLKQHNMTAADGYKYFVKKAHDIGVSLGKTVMQWVEVFDDFGTALAKDTVIHVWKQKQTLQKVVADEYHAVLSDYDLWYLDQLGVTWEKMYLNEPFENITNTTQQSYILGGELTMWGETVDPSDVEQTIWPRGIAGAERLWSPQYVNDTDKAKPRFEYMRCLFEERGIGAAPLDSGARSAPPGPGACAMQ